MGLRGPKPKPPPPPKPRAKPKGPGKGRWGSGPIQCNTCNHEQRARIDYLLATGSTSRTIEAQYGLRQQNVALHFRNHVSARFKKMCLASRLESFEALLKQATEANAETLDLLNLLVRGHAQRWGIALERCEDGKMALHANRVLTGDRIALENNVGAAAGGPQRHGQQLPDARRGFTCQCIARSPCSRSRH